MTLIRRLILALALMAGLPAFAQAPAPVPALPDTERRTSYSISGTTCICNVNFALYGDSTDYQNWLEVWLNGVNVAFNDPTFGWTITVPTQTLATRSRPISDAILTFANAQSGTVQIVGARRPRRVSQYSQNGGVPTRNFNQDLTDIIATQRELWDKTNDMTGRGLFGLPGETLGPLPARASRLNQSACWDSNGNLISCSFIPSTTTLIAGAGIVLSGTNPTAISFTPTGTTIPNSSLAAMPSGTVKCNQTASSAAPGDCTGQLPINAYQFGIKCDGSTNDGPGFISAFAAINAGTIGALYLPPGICVIATNAFLNTFTTPGILTVPGIKIIGQGRGITRIDTRVSGGYAISANPAWAALHQSMFALSAGTSGSLASNTYFVQTTITDNLGNEVNVSPAKSAPAVTGPSGSVSLTLAPINAGYCYNIYIGTTSTPANYATISGADAICKSAGAVTITATGSAHAVPTNKNAVWQEAQLSNLSITNTTAVANASGVLWFRVGYSRMTNVYMVGLTGDGLDIPNWTGDSDGSFVVTIDQSKFDTISGTCVNTAGNTLEFSNFTISNSLFNLCGTLPTNYGAGFVISAITNANPGVVTTSSPHTMVFGDQVFINNVAGMSLPSTMYRACGTVSGSTFSLCDLNGNNVNTTALGSYTASSGLVNLEWRPPQMQANGNGPSVSGAIAWTGLIGSFINNGFTQNKNYDFYVTEAGANDNATFVANDMENTTGKGIYAASVVNMSWSNGECITTTALGQTISCMQLGTGLNKGGAQNIRIDGVKIRSDSGVANGFEQFLGAGALIYQNTVSVANVFWQTWAGLNKFVGFQGNARPFFFARFDGKTGAACTLKDSFNVASCVRNGTGDYTLTFTTPVLDANYAVTGSGNQTGVAGGTVGVTTVANLTTTAARVTCFNFSSAAQDCDVVSVVGHGSPY